MALLVKRLPTRVIHQTTRSLSAVYMRRIFSREDSAAQRRRTNITDDFSWIKGNHSFGFGTNIRIVRNNRENFAAAFDNGITNQSFYAGSGNVVSNPINAWLPIPDRSSGRVQRSRLQASSIRRHAFAALLGRLSQYTANFNFNVDGTPLDAGEPVIRSFATEEYDVYAQDIWKLRDNVTLTYGLRYGLSRPVYERNGFQTRPSVGLQEYLDKRFAAAARGENFDEPLTVVLAGPVHDAPGFYELDKNNFQPRVALAWSPGFKSGFLSKLFGSEEQSDFRGGFAITNDYFGQALAVNFDGNNTLGFRPNQTPSANTFNVTTDPGPADHWPGNGDSRPAGNHCSGKPDVPTNSTAGLPTTNRRFARYKPRFANQLQLELHLRSPVWQGNLLLRLHTSARLARNLLATRDVMQLNNIVDPERRVRIGTPQQEFSNNIALMELRSRLFPTCRGLKTCIRQERLMQSSSALGLTNSQAAYAVMAAGPSRR